MNPPLLSTATRYFMEVVRTGSITDAAQAVHVAPSAVSRQVAKLEESLGCPLFERQSRGMALTEAGERLAAWVHRAQQDTERVADEVRALAGRASKSAREIKSLISQSAERVAAGNDSVAQARERMDGVLDDVNRVARTLDGIRRSADEQQQGVAQVTESVSQLDGITQQNAALVEQLAESAQALEHQMEVVDSSLHIFRLRESDTTVAEVDAVALRRECRGAVAA